MRGVEGRGVGWMEEGAGECGGVYMRELAWVWFVVVWEGEEVRGGGSGREGGDLLSGSYCKT